MFLFACATHIGLHLQQMNGPDVDLRNAQIVTQMLVMAEAGERTKAAAAATTPAPPPQPQPPPSLLAMHGHFAKAVSGAIAHPVADGMSTLPRIHPTINSSSTTTTGSSDLNNNSANNSNGNITTNNGAVIIVPAAYSSATLGLSLGEGMHRGSGPGLSGLRLPLHHTGGGGDGGGGGGMNVYRC